MSERQTLQGSSTRELVDHVHERLTAVRERTQELGAIAGERLDRVSERVLVQVETAKVRFLPGRWIGRAVPTEEQTDAQLLRRPALLGFLALCAVAVGASLPSSPFKVEAPGAWFFGTPRTPGPTGQGLMVGLVAVYGGLVLFMRVWYRLCKAMRQRPGVPVRYLGWILALWLIPMLIVPPLFSQDVYSYAGQGEMVSHHISPYLYGPYQLGGTPFANPHLVNPLWGWVPAPYGPLFLVVDGMFASLSFHTVLGTVVLLRLLAVAGVVLIAWCVPRLARLHDRDPSTVFALAVLNPLVLLSLVASAHNDAIMLGLMLWGITLAKERRPVLGVIVCTLAAAIKVPAELAVLYIGWTWLGPNKAIRERVRPVVTALLISGAVMVVLTMISGFGFGWIANLETPGTVRSWLAPATGVGMALTGFAHLVHLDVSQSAVLSVTRVTGLLGAAVAGVYLLPNSDRYGMVRSLGMSLLLFVALGPVVQPWYLTWGLLTLAIVATGWTRRMILVLSVLSPFIGLPGGRNLLDQLIHANPLAAAAALIVLLGVLLAPLGRWTRAESREASPHELATDLLHPVSEVATHA